MIKTLLFNLFSSSKNSFTLNVKLMCLGMFFVVNLGFSQTTWTGNAGTTAWNTSGNWSNGVPDATDDVIIPNVAIKPLIGNYSAIAKSITINSSASLTLNNNTSSLLTISGNFTNNGILLAGASSTVTINGSTASLMLGSAYSSSSTSLTTFGNLTINKGAAATSVTSNTKAFLVTGNLTVTRGNLILTAPDADYPISGNLVVAAAGTLTHNVDWDLSGKKISVSGNVAIDGTYGYDVARAHLNMIGTGSARTIKTGSSSSGLSILTLSLSSGTVTANGLVTINDNFWASWTAGGSFTTGANTINANSGGGINSAGGTFTISNGGTVNVTGGFNVGKAGTDGIVTLVTGGTLNADAITLGETTATTTCKGTFNHSGGTANIGNLTIDGTGANAYNCTSSPTINITGNWINNKTFTPATSTVNFIGTGTQTISGSSTTPFYNLTVNKTSGILSLISSNQTIGNNLTITAGTLDLSTFTLNRVALGGTLNIANGATLRIGDTSNYPANFGAYTLGATSIVDYYALANQTIGAVKYGNLVLSGSGIKTFPTSIVTIVGNLNINSGVVANLSTAAVTHTAGTLTLGGMSTPAGTWGNTVSNPLNINDTYFAATVGKVNVGASCTSPTVYTMTGVTNKTYCSTEAGSTIGLSSSDNGVSYQLKKGSVIVATVANGTGSPISFGVYNSTGNYTVVATRVGTLCTANMSGSINIYRTSSPPVPEATPINASCPGIADGKINVTNAFAPASLAFDSAKNQYVDFGTPLLSDKTAFTVEGWIKFDPTKYVDRMSLFGQNDVVEVAFEDGGIKCWTKYGFVVAPLTLIPAGYDWHHIAATGDATTLIIYIDGVEAKRLTVGASANYGNSTFSTKIGYGIMDAAGIGLTGEVFKLGFWNRALPIAEIKALSSGFVQYDASLSGLLTGYSFNETTGSTTIAGVGSVAPTGTLTASPTSNPKPVWTDPYTYSWTSNPPGFTSNSKNIANLTNGTYILTTSLKGCSNAGSWTVNANNLATTITDQPSSAAICAGSNTSFGVTATGTNLGYKWQVSTNGGGAFNDVPNAVPYSNVTSATLNITAAGTTLNNYQYRCVVSGTCLPAVNSSAVTLTVNPPFTAPTVGTVTPISCTAATGSIALSGLPAGSWTITQSGFVSTTIGGAGTTRIISGLAKGSYSFTVTEGNCTSGSTASIEIKDESETIWNGTTWSNGNPTKDKKVTITSVSPNQPFVGDPDPKVYKEIYACSLTINSSSSEVIVPGNVTLVVTNAVITTGNLTFKNNSSLVQVSNTAVNSGNIVYERSTTPILRKDYVYWSTPVSPQTFGALSPASSKFYSNDGTQWVVAAKTDNMLVGSGYIIRAPDNYSYSTRQIYPAIFTGVPNTGDIEGESLLVDRSYVIGNPYPSAISADMLLDQNKMLDGTIYFWTHNTPQNIEAVNQYSSDDYAVYNSSGGVSASAKSDPLHNDDPSLDKGNKPTGKIAAGQGFYVSTILSGKVKFNNLMRLGAIDNTQFFKPGAAGAIEKNRVWLNMTNANGAFKQLLVSYIEGATNDYDNRYDGLTFNANPYLDFYSVGNDINYVIQGRALPFVDTDIVPLGYETTIKGDFTISIDEVDGKMSNQAIYLEDKKTGEIHDLRASDYTFKTEIGTFTDRLVLRYTGRTLGTGNFENLENGILVSVKNKVINVLSSKENIKEVTVFDVSGKLLYNKKKVGNTELQISNLPAGDQVLLVKVTLENNFTTDKKIVF